MHHPREFINALVRVSRSREPSVPIEQVAKDFGVHAMMWQKWLQRVAIDDAARYSRSSAARSGFLGRIARA